MSTRTTGDEKSLAPRQDVIPGPSLHSQSQYSIGPAQPLSQRTELQTFTALQQFLVRSSLAHMQFSFDLLQINPLKPELNSICYLLAL